MDQKGPNCHAQRLMRHRHVTATSTQVGPEAKGAKGSAPAEDADP